MIFTKDVIKKSFWALKSGEVLDLLETTNEGLSEEEVLERRELFGINKIAAEKRSSLKLRIFFNQCKSPLIFLLAIAGTITIILKDYPDAAVIFAAVLVNIALGFYQENKAEEALAHLKSYIEERIRIIRDNREYEIATEDLVPGDIVRISQGDRIPADARLIYTNDLMVDEAILTGEALPVHKNTEPVGFQATLGDQTPMVFSGTLVVQGFANAVVCKIGSATEIGRIATMVKEKKREETPLQKAIVSFSVRAGVILVILTAIVFFIGIFTGRSLLEMFLTSVAILVSAVPEGLPIAMTVILAIGVQRLAKKNGVIRKLLAAETLGNTTVILTDKTGTLTEAKMELSQITVFNQKNGITDDFVMRLAVVNSDVIIENPRDPHDKWRIIGRPLEVAVIKAANKMEILPQRVKQTMAVLDYLPFNSSNKFSASLIDYEGKTFSCLFGAPDIILHSSTKTSEAEKKKISQAIDAMAYSGERVLGIAIKEVADPEKEKGLVSRKKFDGFDFIATITFTDPIRPGVRDTIHRIGQVGIKTVIVTGDHRGTAEAIAKELGFPIHAEHVINGPDLDVMPMEELKHRLPLLRIVSRVSPEGKVKIVQAFQEAGEVVAMTGDGINDAPSLKQADIGIAMGSGTDVAKDVAELVLLDDNYQTIVAAINEGRRTVENIRKVIVYLLSSVFDELVLIGGSLVMGVALPLSAIQILWVNFFTESFPALALAFEDGIDYLLEKPKKMNKNLLDKEMRFLIFAVGIPSSALLFVLYLILLKLGFDEMLVRTFIFASFGTYTLLLVFSVRSLQKSIIRYNPFSNRYLVLGSAFGLLMVIGPLYLPFFQKLMGTVALPPAWLLGVFGIGVLNILAIEFGKWLHHRKLS